ncbi:uncharacterized protein [Amphiura filiformis]|uniref:uncharacterized protein n=1 Tax=Amphiura filiformis TaxID=82378 RepID=UPI003B21E474
MIDVGSPVTDINGSGQDVQPTVSPSKRRRLENLVQGLASSTTERVSVREMESDPNLRPGDVMGFHHDIFNTDGDRKELIDYCEKMLEECKNPTHQDHPTGTELVSISRDETTPTDPAEDRWNNFEDMDSDPYRNAFDIHDAFEDQQLKYAYYFDGERFVSIQVIMDVNTGECQLVLPIDHPHHLGVPEEVPIFETKRVPVENFKQR